jgi:hypothetical protein
MAVACRIADHSVRPVRFADRFRLSATARSDRQVSILIHFVPSEAKALGGFTPVAAKSLKPN